MTIPLRFVIK